MIKNFLTKIEELTADAWLAILSYIDGTLDEHDKKIEELEERLNEFEKQFDSTKAEVESQSDTRKLIKKVALTTGIGIIVASFLRFFGLY